MYLRTSGLLLLFFSCCTKVVFTENTGSGTEGNLRLCIVEGRGSYKRGNKYCPILDEENSGIECVIGVDRLDCLRRIAKGTVDFGAFSPEDLIAAQWADIDVLVTNELRLRNRPFARSVVAVVNRAILPDVNEKMSVSAILRNSTLCHPAVDVDDLRPLSETLARYMESLVTVGSCDPKLSLTENRIKATADFFNMACMAGPWVPDKARDAELKRRYPSLCHACAKRTCAKTDPYWGDSGALSCLGMGIGDVTWAELDDVRAYFHASINKDLFSFLCRDGSSMPLDADEPCVWLHQPWNIIVSKRKATKAVIELTASLTNSSVTVDQHWRGALAALLEVRQQLPAPLQPPRPPLDFLAAATGFREAYSQHGCNPPRDITLCTTSILENNKCDWLAEAAAVYGVAPPLQCRRRNTLEACMEAVRKGEIDAVVADGDWLVRAQRDFSLIPVLHEATPIIDKMTTVSAYVRSDSGIKSFKDLRGKRAAFPKFDGVAWHSVLNYLTEKEQDTCKNIANSFFSSICAPGIEKRNVSTEKIQKYTQNCYKNGNDILEGEEQALRSLVEGNSDVAFISRSTYNLYNLGHIATPLSQDLVELNTICHEENPNYCFISWSNIGHVFTSNNLTEMRMHEIINVLTKLDQLFGNHAHRLMFSMYGPFQHELDVLFHNNTRLLATDNIFNIRPYSEIPLSFEQVLNKMTNVCHYSDFTTDFGIRLGSNIFIVLLMLVLSFIVRK